jgi:serine phosphatase RsbU (regulator of sigma subunit)/anti-sigma regulatory factor (Ser/Thr protein kinase)
MTLPRIQTMRPDFLRLRLGCELAEVHPAAMEATSFLRSLRVSEEEIQHCELALVEACNNAIQYAEDEGRDKAVEVEVACDGAEIEMRVRDHTPGFALPDISELPDFEQESGRGLFLIRSVMGTVDYLRGKEGNSLVMRKPRSGGDARAPALSGTGEGAETREGQELQEPPPLQELNRKVEESEQIITEMAEELSFCYESLSAIFRCSAELGQKNNLEYFSQRLLTDLSQITSAEWFILRLVAKEESRLVVFAASEPSLQLMPLPLTAAHAVYSTEMEAALTRQDIWFDEERPLKATDPLGSIKVQAIGLIHPFFFGDTLVGTLTVGKDTTGEHFTAVHANVIHTFADFLAIQIVNARFHEEQVASRVLSRELEIAKNIQRSLLPKSLPSIPGFSLAGCCESARQVGGDFYDVLEVNDHCLLLTIADVMGKGIPAAIFAAILRSLLRAVPEWSADPGALLGRVNRLLFADLSGVDMFITAQLIFVNTRERSIVAASAGHCPTLAEVGEEGHVRLLAAEGGLPLGILPDASYGSQKEILGENHRLLLYTDGLTEARNPQGEFFGQERLMSWFKGMLHERRTADELKRELTAELGRFQATSVLNDDQTFLIMAQ